MSHLPLFPELDMISRVPTRYRKPTPKQLVLFYGPSYERYTLQLKRATPAWADTTALGSFYAEARRRTIAKGVLYVVDHIVPLNGGIVCGLHVPANLQVMHWKANGTKGARWWPHMPIEQQELFKESS